MSKNVTSILFRRPGIVAIVVGTIMVCSLPDSPALAMTPVVTLQEKETSSSQESEAIKAVEAAGGRVYRISAADTTREISFNLASAPIGDEQLSGLSAIGEVIWMNLAGTNVTNDGLQHLVGMPLKKLHLERTKIGDEGLVHVKSLKDLEYLNVYDTKVTDAGLDNLKELKNLKKLYVWKSEVTEAGIKKLNESLPDLEIVGELKLEPAVIEEPKKEDPPKTETKDQESAEAIKEKEDKGKTSETKKEASEDNAEKGKEGKDK